VGIYEELARLEDEGRRLRQPYARPHSAPGPGEEATTAAHEGVAEAPTLVTLPLGPLDLRTWRMALENNDTRRSALRLTSSERDRVEDLVRELWRVHRLRSSMNEVARLGLRVIERDFRRRGQESLVYRVKSA